MTEPKINNYFSINNSNYDRPESDTADNPKSRSLLLCVGSLVVFIGCGVLYSVMEEENWSQDEPTQERVVVLATLLLITSVALCYFAMKGEVKEEDTEEGIRLLVVDSPPSYNSLKAEDPPPPYWLTSCRLLPLSQGGDPDPAPSLNASLLGVLELPAVHRNHR